MTRTHLRKGATVAAAGAFLLQITACFGPDPQFFITNSVSNALIANLIDILIGSLTGALAA